MREHNRQLHRYSGHHHHHHHRHNPDDLIMDYAMDNIRTPRQKTSIPKENFTFGIVPDEEETEQSPLIKIDERSGLAQCASHHSKTSAMEHLKKESQQFTASGDQMIKVPRSWKSSSGSYEETDEAQTDDTDDFSYEEITEDDTRTSGRRASDKKKARYIFDSDGIQETEEDSDFFTPWEEPEGKHRHNHEDEHSHHSSGHSKRKRHRRRSVAGRILATLCNIISVAVAVLLAVVGIFYGTWRLMEYTGGLSLYSRTKEQVPDMSAVDEQAEMITAGAADSMSSTGDGEWQPGWIRYNGKTYEYRSDLLTFLVLGIDCMDKVHEGEDGISGGQSDAMFFLVLDPDSKDISIVAINRNSMTDIDVYNTEGEYVGTGEAQICLQHGFGNGLEQSCDRTVGTVRRLFHQLPVNGYISINMGAIPTVNKTVGGVTVDVLENLPANGHYRALHRGDTVRLTGDDAYWYTQYRNTDKFNSAADRLERQLQYLINFVPALQQEIKDDPTSVASIYTALSPYMVTDIDIDEAVYLGTEAAGYNFNTDRIYQMEGATKKGESGFEEFAYDEDALCDLIIKVFYREVTADV